MVWQISLRTAISVYFTLLFTTVVVVVVVVRQHCMHDVLPWCVRLSVCWSQL